MGGRVSYNFDGHNAAEFSMANPFSLSANYAYNFFRYPREMVYHT